jgi:hypothetical protein
MNIIDFPPSIDDFNSLHFPEIAMAWVKESEQQIELLANQKLRDFNDLQSFVKTQIENRRIKVIQVVPVEKPQSENCAHYICFGDDPDSLGNSISFRIDQNWDNFAFPQGFSESVLDHLKRIIFSLSGAVIGRLDFPEIILSKKWIGNPEICYSYSANGNIINSASIQKGISDYFLLADDYWNIATIIDKLGIVWLWNTKNQKDFEIRPTGLNIREWFQAELQNPFRQRLEPEWTRQKTA